jgi:two-component system sensor histidine kinase YesM
MDTIQSRFALINAVTITGCFLLIALSAMTTIRNVAAARSETTMDLANTSITVNTESEFDTLLQISQQMVPSGSVGRFFSEYLSADNNYEKYLTRGNLESAFTIVMFTANAEFGTYYNTRTGENYLSNLAQMKRDFSLSQPEHVLAATHEITYHSLHVSQSHLSNYPVVSIVRKGRFAVDEDVDIYIEVRSSTPELLQELTRKNGLNYQFIQLNEDGIVCYSGSDEFPVGSDCSDMIANASNDRWGSYIYRCTRQDFGFYNVLLLPETEYYGSVSEWLRMLILAFLTAVLLIVLSNILLYRLIIKKNKSLESEIQRVSEGNLEAVTQKTGLREYDLLLEKFDQMLLRIRTLIVDVAEKERQRGKMAREVLYCQINPHFLLNSLNSAYWLAKMNSQNGTDRYLSQLTAILRYSLGQDGQRQTLRREIEMLRVYLELERQRSDFEYSIEVEDGAYLDAPSPRLLIQPIAENSICHGIGVGGKLEVAIGRRASWIEISVLDDGIGIDEETIQRLYTNMEQPAGSSGIGLRYVRTVMRAYYGRKPQ